MHMFVEDLTGLWKRMIITVSCNCFKTAIDNKFKTLSKTMRIAGFRVGKIPMSFLEKKYGDIIRQETMFNLMEQNFIHAISKKSIKLISNPKYEILELCNYTNKNFVYSVTVEVCPKIQLTGLDHIIIEKPVVDITEQDIDLIMNTEKQQYTFWENNDTRKIHIGDRVTFSVTIQPNDTAIVQNFCFHDIEKIAMIIGKSNHDTIYDLENKMLGCTKGDTFNIYFDFPKNYHITDLIEKRIFFLITIKKIETAKFSKLHQDYFEYYNYSTVRKDIQCNLHKFIKQYVKNQIVTYILSINNFDVPVTLIANELNKLKNKAKKNTYYIDHKLSGRSLSSLILEEFNLEYQAKRKVQFLLLLHEIVQCNKITVDHKFIPQFVEKILGRSDYSKKIIKSLNHDINIRNYFNFLLLEELVIDLLVKRSKSTEKKITFSKLINF